MSDNGRVVALGRGHSRLIAASHVQSLYEMEVDANMSAISLSASGERSGRAAMQWLGRAINELFECNRCFVATVPGDECFVSEQEWVGHAATNRVAEATIASTACRLSSQRADLLPMNATDPLVISAIGGSEAQSAYSVIGRINAGNGSLIFVAGWRASPLSQEEVRGLARATRVIWATAKHLTHTPPECSDLQKLLGELVLPAFVVDGNLRLQEVNRYGKQLLLKGDILSANDGFLLGATCSGTDDLREAVSNALIPSLDQRWKNSTIMLTSGHQKYAFAWVGMAPVNQQMGRVLIIVPRIDEAMGARRIASTFSLNCVEERIIARILRGRCPRDIGAELGLTEATVRTYTKRMMLKLNINRQSELFLLYILTLSPFGSGRPERALSNVLPCSETL